MKRDVYLNQILWQFCGFMAAIANCFHVNCQYPLDAPHMSGHYSARPGPPYPCSLRCPFLPHQHQVTATMPAHDTPGYTNFVCAGFATAA